MEGKRNDTGMRFVLQQAVESNQRGLLWSEDHFSTLIDWKGVEVAYGLRQGIKYAQLVRHQASSPRARGADGEGNRYFVQVIVEGTPYQKAKNLPGTDTMELDIGPSTLAVVPREGEAHLVEFCQELRLAIGKKRRLQRRATNPHNPLWQGAGQKRWESPKNPRALAGGGLRAHQVCLSLHRFL